MLIDEVEITIKAGDGGNGAVSFRHEKNVPKGGPDGGDGANGGHVYIVANPSTHGLARYRGKKNFAAQSGQAGMGNRSSGKAGEDLYLSVPPGTRIMEVASNNNRYVIADLTKPEETIRLARGGKGGKGNWHFRSATNQVPRQFEPGTPGEERKIVLELQLIADVGLVGLPNAGKSTLLSVISNARPKIADYPFTTLEPNLGVVEYHDEQFVVADIPGLIEGAATGKGLGHEFLKHILRTSVIVHLIPVTEPDPQKSYDTIRKELDAFDRELITKPEIVVMSQIDLLPEWKEYHKDFVQTHKAIGISAVVGTGLDEVMKRIVNQLKVS